MPLREAEEDGEGGDWTAEGEGDRGAEEGSADEGRAEGGRAEDGGREVGVVGG